MPVVRRIARPLMASIFITGGLQQLRKPGSRSDQAAVVGPGLANAVNQSPAPVTLPTDPETLTRLNGAIMVGAGTMLATSRFPRLASTVLAASLVPTTLAGHRFWEAESAEQRVTQRTQFQKNLSMLGGLMIAAVDTEGRESVPRATKRAAKRTRQEAKRAAKEAKMSAKAGTRVGKSVARSKAKQGQASGGRAVEKVLRTAGA